MKVFNYWEGNTPSIISLCQKTFRLNSGIEYVLLDNNTIYDWIDISKEEESLLQKLPHIAQKVDYYRAKLIYEHGGIWFDADTILYQNLHNVIKKINEHKFVGWVNMRQNPAHLAINFFGANPKNEILKKWVDCMVVYIKNQNNFGWASLNTQCLWNIMKDHKYYQYPKEKIGLIPAGKEPMKVFWKNNDTDFILKHDPITTMLYGGVYMHYINNSEEEILNEDSLISKLFKYSFSKKQSNGAHNIYKRNLNLNIESVSGFGSSKNAAKDIIHHLPIIINKFKIETIIDVPCGDWNWMKEIDLSSVTYLGLDIIDDLIKENNKKYSKENVSFKKFNAIINQIDYADLIISRDFLFHLSWDNANIFLKMLKRSKSKYLLTTTFDDIKENTDLNINQKNAGWGFRKINVEKEPYNLKNSVYQFSELNGQRKLKLYDIT